MAKRRSFSAKKRVSALEGKIARNDEVIAEITESHVRLKRERMVNSEDELLEVIKEILSRDRTGHIINALPAQVEAEE